MNLGETFSEVSTRCVGPNGTSCPFPNNSFTSPLKFLAYSLHPLWVRLRKVLAAFQNELLEFLRNLQSGFPLTPQLSYNPSNNGDTRNPVRPFVNPNFTGPIVLGNPNQWFNPAAFIAPPSASGVLRKRTAGSCMPHWVFQCPFCKTEFIYFEISTNLELSEKRWGDYRADKPLAGVLSVIAWFRQPG